MSKTRRGGSAAVTPEGVRGALRRALLGHYDHDAEFTDALEQLWVEHASGLALTANWRTTPPLYWIDEPSRAAVQAAFEYLFAEPGVASPEQAAIWTNQYESVAAYLDALSGLAQRFGLDHLGDEGIDTLHAWCNCRHENGAHWAAAHFSHGYQKFGPVPEVGEVSEYDLGEQDLDGHRIRLIWRDVTPVIRIDGHEVIFDPTLRRRSYAFARLRKWLGKRHEPEIRAELDRLEADAEAAGAKAYDTRPNVARDIEWLFWHLRHRDGPGDVAKRAGLDEDAVPKITMAVGRVAKDAEITLRSGWATWTGEPSAASQWVS